MVVWIRREVVVEVRAMGVGYMSLEFKSSREVQGGDISYKCGHHQHIVVYLNQSENREKK